MRTWAAWLVCAALSPPTPRPVRDSIMLSVVRKNHKLSISERPEANVFPGGRRSQSVCRAKLADTQRSMDNLCAHPAVRKELKQDCVRDAAVNNMGFTDPSGECMEAGFDFG